MASSESLFDATKLFSAKGLVCVVTGGGTGIGLMIATALEHNGAEKVYIVGRRKEILENAAKTNNKFGRIIPIVGDVTSKASLQAMVDQITAEIGYINLLVANSGITGPLQKALVTQASNYPDVASVRKFLWDNHDEDLWASTFQTNITGVYLTTVAFLDLLDEGNRRKVVTQTSQVVAVSSTAAFHRLPGTGIAYSASKAGMTHMMKMMSTILGSHNIRVNIVAPGVYPSQMSAGEEIDGRNRSVHVLEDKVYPAHEIPMQRAGQEQEMAATILWLAGEGGGYTSGCIVVTDGGRLSILPGSY
ncbi:hypothetical protein BDZ91DRAFT_737186 [Kalaharituber pfeilii]|nr:hypothetical protein BDZ91DRAFT_737186 [Kalaharituber pfeilii]